ncbi:hypothetical protein F5B17DRAFT_304075 [Nemania serpens]|nr:hypothetical protein F5B17DRAFT_304075 [Nemania serpens]
MSPGLRPLRLPLMVERRRKQEEEAAAAAHMAAYEIDGDCFSTHQYQHRQHQQPCQPTPVIAESIPSNMTSPVTPTFSARGHLRYSSSMSSFDLALPASCEDSPPSPIQPLPTPSKRTLDDVEEEPFEYDRFNHYDKGILVAYDDVPDHWDLYDCLCDEPCIHRDADMVRTTTNFYARGRALDSDLACLSDSDSPARRSSRTKRRNGSLPPFMGLSHRIGARFPSLARWRSPRKPSASGSPVSDKGSERHAGSRAASSRSSSVSRSHQYLPDRFNEPALPPTPALSFFDSSDSITLSGPLDVGQADYVLSSIQRERAQATTPLLPPLMTSSPADYVSAQPSPLQSPTIASPLEDEPQSPRVLSPPLSTKPSISSFPQVMMLGDVPPIPAPDAWSDRLGHANFTILPVPYKPEVATLSSLRQLRADWETARVNYTKHLVRTGEHYSLTSKTYLLTEQKWSEIDGTWRAHHDKILETVVASGEASGFEKFDETIITTVPIMDGEGKFPERGDEDIVGPMVREAMMTSPTGTERRRPSFWRNLTDRVSLRK